ncbi:hypothetical protein DN745_14130 [Bradymonas sediminis]|uniref:VDE lipocalin domain-containing protein n=2 Tax=Bradymonas sediminis TaxID=1548548 RepID=A0A2Z4FP18_9DELT|nr:hypothetical protein DN745_14130 [Bradymonas sediminis]
MERNPMSQAKNIRFMAVGLVLMALCALTLMACSAATQTKQGAPGERCMGQDGDCRPGLLCEDSVCVLPDSSTLEACTNSCEKIGACGVNNLNCFNECSTTVKNWSDSVIEEFGDCLVNDLSCEELGGSANAAAQACYDRLPTPAERLDTCRDFKASLKECAPDGSTAAFERACIRTARTTDASDWSAKTSYCLDLTTCEEATTCINAAFGLN